MSEAIIITLCILLLIAYIFDLTSSKTKIPSVILLLFLGWFIKQTVVYLNIKIPELESILPILGTVGLILIVLEGALELELNKSKRMLIAKSFYTALIPMLVCAFGIAYFMTFFGYMDFRNNLLNAIPLCIISSSIAIPSVRGLSRNAKEFVIYESSLSDIFGVLLFNFIVLNTTIGLSAFANFSLQLIIITVISFIATVGLAFLLSKVTHHIKFIPIILLIVLIYEISKEYHLPSLVFILFFGLFIGNIDEMKSIKWIQKLKPEELNREAHKLKELNQEVAFLIRSIFFLLFGFLIETSDLLNLETLKWSLGITAGIFVLRAIQLLLLKLPLNPLLFIAPRGLITILLFVSISPAVRIPLIDNSLIIQVIVLTAVIMMIGLMLFNKEEKKTSPELSDGETTETNHKNVTSEVVAEEP